MILIQTHGFDDKSARRSSLVLHIHLVTRSNAVQRARHQIPSLQLNIIDGRNSTTRIDQLHSAIRGSAGLLRIDRKHAWHVVRVPRLVILRHASESTRRGTHCRGASEQIRKGSACRRELRAQDWPVWHELKQSRRVVSPEPVSARLESEALLMLLIRDLCAV